MHHDRKHDQEVKFKIAHREAWVGVGLAVFNFIWWYGFAYGFGSQPISHYKYILGLPAWFFYSCVLGLFVMIVLVALFVKFYFKDIPLDEVDEERDSL